MFGYFPMTPIACRMTFRRPTFCWKSPIASLPVASFFVVNLLVIGTTMAVAAPNGATDAPPQEAAASESSGPLLKAKSAMRVTHYAEAIALLDRVVEGEKIEGEKTDEQVEALYLQSLSQYYLKKYPASIQTAERVIALGDKTSWLHKARFLQARSLVALRQFKKAELIYQEESHRLLSKARKHEIASVILSFADALAKKPEQNDVGALPPDYGKAYKLYGKTLEMEIGRDLRDEVMFKRAQVILLAGNAGQAIADFRAYLKEFDPEWTGPVGSSARMAGRKRENPKPAGKQVLAARYHLAKAQLQAKQHAAARVNAEDLLDRIGQIKAPHKPATVKLTADTAWLRVQTYRMPSPAGHELDKAVQVTRQFLASHPRYLRSVQAAWYLPEAYRQRGRADQAIAEYQKFIAGETYSLPKGEQATEKLEGMTQSPAELADGWKKVALFRIGQLRYGQKKYDEATEAWTRYIGQFPNGPHWAKCQQGIVDAEYQAAVDAVAEKEYAQARQLFQDFLTKHPLDGRAAQILYLFGQIDYIAATELEEKKSPEKQVQAAYQKAIDRWQQVVSKYPNVEQSSLALYQIGVIHEEKLGQLDQALDAYRRLKWGSWASHAQVRLVTMTQKHLEVTTERKFRTNEKVSVKVNTRNIEKLTCKQYFLDLEAYFRKTHEVGRVDGLDIDLIQPDKTWEVDVADYAKYQPFEQQIEIPFKKGKAGVCIVNITGCDFEATTLVVRSDLDLIVKCSRKELLVFVQNMITGKPAKGVKLLVSNGKKVLATGTTADDGTYQGKYDELKQAVKARVFAIEQGSIASNLLDLSGMKFSQGLAAKGYLYTDRSAYQPGQRVKFRGIVRDVKKGAYVAPAGEKYEVSITDAAGRLLWEEPVKLSEFGTFHSEFRLPASAAVGSYQLSVHKPKGPTYSSTFQVQAFKLEKLKLALETDRRVYFRGEVVELSIEAAYYWGQPAAEKTIRYRLPDGRQLAEKTDAEGKLTVKFDTSGMQPGAPLRFTASMEGENVAATHSAMLAVQGFNIAVKPSRRLVLSGEPVELDITTTTPDGKPVSQEVTLTVLRRTLRQANPVLSGVPWFPRVSQPAEEVTLLEKKVTTDKETGKATVRLNDKALQPGGVYLLRVSGTDRFKQVVTGQANFRISDDDDATKLRLFAKTDQLQVGKEIKVRLHSRLGSKDAAKLALITLEGETILSHRIVSIKKGFNLIDLQVDHQHFPNFRLAVSIMDDQALRSASKAFRVERKLKVTLRPLADAYAPGAPGKVEITVTDQLGRPVRGELSLAMVDEALFAQFPDRTPNILHFFQRDAHRHAEFRETSTCGFRYEATTRKVLQAYTNEQERIVRSADEKKALVQLGDRRDGRRFRQLDALQSAQRSVQLYAADAPQQNQPVVNRLGQSGKANWSALTAAAEDAEAEDVSRGNFRGVGVESSSGNRFMNSRLERFSGEKSSFFEADESDGESTPREELADAGWWSGSIVTDEAGKATVEIPMPETTTEWRLTTRGVTVETLVGQATGKVLTRKDFFVTLKAARQLQEGDSMQMIARVHNLTDYAGPVKLDFTLLGGNDLTSQLAQRTLSVEITKQGVAEVVFDAVKIPSASQVQLQVQATAGDLNDSLLRTVPVRPWGLEFSDQAGGLATDTVSTRVKLPAGREYQTQWMTLSVGPNLDQSLIDMAMGGKPVPYGREQGNGCFYPTPARWGNPSGSHLLATVRTLRYAKATGATQNQIERLTRRARSLVSALVVSQRDDGGWGWMGRNNASEWGVSSMNYWALTEAKQLGLVVHAPAYNKAKVYLQNRFTSLQQSDNDAKAVVLHALSTSQSADFAHVNRLHRERNGLSSPALAYTALALANLGRNDQAGEVLDVLEKKSKPEGAANNRRLAWQGSSNHFWLSDQVETTAIAALALMRVRPASPKVAESIAWLLDQKGAWGFAPSKANGPALAALSQYYALGKHSTDDYRLTLLVNGKPFRTIDSSKTKERLLLSVPSKLLKPGENRVEFQMEGRGEFSYAVSMRGFSSDLKDPKSWDYPRVEHRRYYHAQLEYRGRPIGTESTSRVKHVEVGQRVRVYVNIYNYRREKSYLVVEEYLPAGTLLVEGSLKGQFNHHVIEGDRIVMYYHPGQSISSIRYELIGYASGTYRALPTVIRDLMNPGRMRLGDPAEMVVLPPGEKSDDPYKMNDSERYALGRLNFEDGRLKEALPHLAYLSKHNHDYNERDVARMLLWIYTSEGFYDAQQIVNAFEVLRERFPTLEIPYDKILMVGRAYRDIGEFERAYQVYRATIDASFINDSNVSAVLEDEGQFLGSIDYQQKLWREYPDTATVSAAYFAISQSLYQKAPTAHLLAKEQRLIAIARGREVPKKSPSKIAMLEETIHLLEEFLTLYPENPLADDAAFSMANALLDLKQYESVVEICTKYRQRFTKSEFQSGFQYMIALGQFWQRQHDEALAAAKVVAEGKSKDRDFARYIIGQIYHAENKPADAIEWYQKVASLYADAKQAIEYFEEKHVAIDEVNVFRPGKPVELTLKYRNIAEARCQVYRVDLMRLYLREKNLTNVTKVNLAGIAPLVETTLELGDGKDYLDKERKFSLDLKEEGAYLVICRGDNLFASALVLITPLEIEVQEDATSGRVRANVINSDTHQYVSEVHVKAIGSADSEFRSGDTDLRGVFVADNVRGKATVIARAGDSRYAFYRGKTWLGKSENETMKQQRPPQDEITGKSKPDYYFNIHMQNDIIQRENYKKFDQMRRGGNKGVEVQYAQ